MAKEDIQIKIDAAVNTAEAAKSLGQLRKSLMEIQTLQAEMGDGAGPQFDKLTQAANAASLKLAETRDRIGDIQDKNRTLEGTPIERLTGSFGLLKDSIMNLDFDKAKIGAEGLLNTFTPVVDGKLVTGFAGIKGALSMLGEGFKTLGSTIVSVGKSILANPIFLLAAIIIGVVAAIVLILDKLGLLKKIMDVLMIPINAIIAGFKMLTDWLGLTTYALEENAAAAKKNGEEQRAEIDKTATAQQTLLKLTEGMTEEEIGYFRKKAGIKDQLNKNSFDIEKTRLEQTNVTIANEIKALEDLKEAGGELTEDQQKDLEQRKKDYAANAEAIKQTEYNKQKAIIDFNKKTTDILKEWQIKNIKDENERAKAQLGVTEAAELRKIDVLLANEMAKGKEGEEAAKRLRTARLEVIKYFDQEEVKLNEGIAKKNAENYKNAVQQQLAEKEKSLQLGIEKLKKANADEETILKAQFDMEDKLLEFKKNKKILIGKALEFEQVRLDNSQKERQAAFDKGELEDYNKNRVLRSETKIKNIELDLAKELSVENLNADEKLKINKSYDERLFNARREAIIIKTDIELEDTKKSEEELNAIRTNSYLEIDALDKEFQDKQAGYRVQEAEQLAAITQAIADKSTFELENHKMTKAQKAFIDKEELDRVLKEYNNQLVADSAAMTAELANIELTEAEKDIIKEKYRQLEIERENSKEEKLKALRLKGFNNTLELANRLNTTTQALGDAIFAWKKKSAGKDLEAQKKAAKDQFNLNKGLQVSTAIITGIQSVMAAFANGMKNPVPLLGPATGGIYAALAGIASAANIAKIMSTTFDSSAFTPATTDTSSKDTNMAADMAAANQQPTNFSPNQFFGLGQTTATGFAGGPAPIKVYVTEGDITGVQQKVSVIETRAVY